MRSIVQTVRVAAFASLARATLWQAALLLFSVSAVAQAAQDNSGMQVGWSYHNDVSPALRDLGVPGHPPETNIPDSVGKPGSWLKFLGLDMPGPILNFDGITCGGCSGRPATDGEVGATQYVQVVANSYAVFDKATGAQIMGPNTIASLFAGFGGVCQNGSLSDGMVLYDQLADRWVVSQWAIPADMCLAISTTSDATGTWNRFAFHLGSNFFAYPKLSVWPDGYYMSVNVSNSSGTAYLGPQPFVFDRAKMLSGVSASVISPGITGGPTEDPYLPADFDGSTLPPDGAPNSFVEFPSSGAYRIFHFHADFITPANSTFTLFASPPAAAFTPLCPGTRNCIPQLGSGTGVDGIGNRLMFRLAYRNFGTPSAPNESMVGNYSVSSDGVSGVRWFELKNVTSGPVTIAQESTYQPDTTWRWLGSAAMDHAGDFAIGFSASDATINPQIRYAGRLATDPPNTLAQGEAHLFDGIGSSDTTNWAEYSVLTVDPVDDCTFWYTNIYHNTPIGSNGRTRIGSFKFPECNGSATPTPTPTPTATLTPTPTPTATLTPTPTPIIDIEVHKTAVPFPVQVGHDLTYTITAFNHGPDTALDVTVTDALPPGVNYVSATASQGSCTGTSTITCNLGTIQGDYSASVTLVVAPTVAGTLSNTATVFAPGDINPSNNSSTQVTTVNPPAAQAVNLSTRMRVQTGADVGIGGFIITGTAPMNVLLRAIGPSLTPFGVPNALADPVMELHGPGGFVTITNDNWRDDPAQAALIIATGIQPTNNLESAIYATLNPGSYTALVSGKNNTSGVGLVEVYDLNQGVDSKLANLSTRAFVDTGSNIVIAGFILSGNSGNDRIVARGLGPDLVNFGVPNPLADPTLEVRDSNGALLAYNNDWQDFCNLDPPCIPTGLAPTDQRDAVISITLPPGPYTALLAGLNNGTGVGIVEVYDLGAP